MNEKQQVTSNVKENVTVSNVNPESEVCGVHFRASAYRYAEAKLDNFKATLAETIIKEAAKDNIALETAVRLCKLIFETQE